MKKDKLDVIGYIDGQLIEKADKYTGVRKKNDRIKWGALAACLCLAVVGAAAIMPKFIHGQGAGEHGGNGQPQLGGTDEGVMYSVAVFSAERERDEVKDAYCEDINEAEARAEDIIGDYLPTELPNGYHFGRASIYVTTMNDDTVYKMLRVTYRTGEEAEEQTFEDGGILIPDTNDPGDEFRISVWGFKPDTSAAVYDADEIDEGKLSESSGFFYVRFGDVYIGVDPLSLDARETVELIDSIKN